MYQQLLRLVKLPLNSNYRTSDLLGGRKAHIDQRNGPKKLKATINIIKSKIKLIQKIKYLKKSILN